MNEIPTIERMFHSNDLNHIFTKSLIEGVKQPPFNQNTKYQITSKSQKVYAVANCLRYLRVER